MKKLFVTLMILACVELASAHTVTPQCWQNGRFGVLIGGVHNNMSVKVTIGKWDTTMAIKGTTHSFTVPQVKLNVPVKLKFKFSDGYECEMWTTTSICNTLPLKYTNYSIEYLGNHVLLYKFTLSEVSHLVKIDILISFDNKEYIAKGVVLADNQVDEKSYSIKIKF